MVSHIMRASSILLWKRRKIWLARETIYLPCILYIAMDSKVCGILMLFCSLMIMIDIRHKVNTRMIALGIDSNNNQLIVMGDPIRGSTMVSYYSGNYTVLAVG